MIIMARGWAHKGFTDMALRLEEEYEEAGVYKRIQHPEWGDCAIGAFIQGLGAFDVHFPLEHVRPATEEELERLTRGRYAGNGIPPFKLGRAEFARTMLEILDLPLIDWRKVA